MRYIFYIFLNISSIVGIHRCSKYLNNDEYREDFIERTESIAKPQQAIYQKIFKYSQYTLLALAGTLLLLTLPFTRWRKIKVFISYIGENEAFTEAIKRAINKYPIEAYYSPYSNLEHNEIIQKVSKMIRRTDAVVAIPGNRIESRFL